ncbi:helix-turn-helix domain-containing protein [Rhodocaloribacter litoris]|uniref:helix-turn-helix domain-containing protein n=1 Tax=Rhodocaloribacter litoris TaxID=2558931 RepID=UPI00141DF15A|nr:helix-turn-helix domain-containing protein [Rhodocaloribacter litoris]QXD17018.1 helix-turn-helix domain-containing protein [Rhodocaloribacter litoris]
MPKKKPEILDEAGLHTLAREAFERSGLTQREAAERLGVTQGAVSQALRNAGGRYVALQCRIVELAGWRCEGPRWLVYR